MLAVLMLGIITACSSAGSESKNNAEESQESNGGEQIASSDEALIVYTNSASNGRGDWLKEKAGEVGFNLEIVEMGGSDLFNRLLAEKNNPIADVTFGMSQMDWQTLKQEEALVAYEPSWIDEIPDGSSDSDNFYHPIAEQRIIMLYNQDTYDETTAPQDWPDLWENEEFHGLYHVPSTLSGGTDRAVIYNILTRHLDENGELGVSDEGWAAVQAYIENGYTTPDGEDRIANLADGTIPISFYYSSGIPGIEEEFSFEAGIVSPEIGVPATVEQVGIMNHGDGQDYTLAHEFIDWFGSAEIQGEWANNFGSLPVNKLAVDQATDRMKEIGQSTSVQEIDYDLVGKYIDEWVEKIELEIY